ncbi:MAG: transposase [Verrucomicrobiaceae bacterium]|nr:MAG: transposase [Verrucomicrobiaceae bacterium]
MKKASPHKGWHSRGYLPHLDAPGEVQALTFRLADAMPAKVIAGWKQEVEQEADFSKRERALRRMIARYEDAGHGDCLLRKPACAEIVQAALGHFDGVRYHLLEWCIMPNHVHAISRCGEGYPLGTIVKSWKIFTAQGINQNLGRTGTVWSKDCFDRYIRDNDHLADARAYIRNNPVKAGLCGTSEEWRWSSAFSSHDPDSSPSPENG